MTFSKKLARTAFLLCPLMTQSCKTLRFDFTPPANATENAAYIADDELDVHQGFIVHNQELVETRLPYEEMISPKEKYLSRSTVLINLRDSLYYYKTELPNGTQRDCFSHPLQNLGHYDNQPRSLKLLMPPAIMARDKAKDGAKKSDHSLPAMPHPFYKKISDSSALFEQELKPGLLDQFIVNLGEDSIITKTCNIVQDKVPLPTKIAQDARDFLKQQKHDWKHQ